jgi:arylsulfatase A-like enzyme
MNIIAAALVTQLSVFVSVLALYSTTANATPTGRNILFIAIDDLRIEPQAITPHIDALAAESTRYNAAYAPTPFCVSSRATVLTGLKPSTHKVGQTFEAYLFSQASYNALFTNPQIKTIQEVLSDNGYYTATTGKVNHTQFPAQWDLAQPYDLPSWNPADPGPDGTYIQRTVLPPGQSHPDQEVADWAVSFLESYEGNEPFFLALGFTLPHLPWRVPQWAYDLYPAPVPYVPVPGDLDDEPPEAVKLVDTFFWNGNNPENPSQYDLIEDAGKAGEYTRFYLAGISHTDAMVGQVLAALAAHPTFSTNTDVVLWSDNGFHLGEKFYWQKFTFWEQSVKVPLLIKSPAIAAGDVNDEVSLLDLAPTLLDLAGLQAEPQFEGVSLASGRSPVEIYYNKGRATVTSGMKSVDYDLAKPGKADQASYDLVSDPLELVNLTTPGC